jgi:hypothetical protein
MNTNYTTLMNAFLAQNNNTSNRNTNSSTNYKGRGGQSNRTFRNQYRGNSQNFSRTTRPRPDITCYACGKAGHFAKDCRSQSNNFNNSNRGRGSFNNNRNRNNRQTRFVLPTNVSRSLNHFESREDNQEEYDYDYNGEYEDDNEYEIDAFVATRATTREGRDDYSPYHSKSKKERELQIMPPTMPRKPKMRKRMNPAPIEDPTAFEVAEYIRRLPCGLTMGQAAYLLPAFRQGLVQASRRTRNIEEESENEIMANYTVQTSDSEEEIEPTTAMQCEIFVGRKAVTIIIDSGASTSIITQKLMKKLGYHIHEPSKVVVVTTNGSKVKPLGIIKEFPIVINHLKIPTTVEVLESPEDLLLLGNDWLIRVGANLNWRSLKFTVNYKGRTETVNATCFAKDFISVRKTIPLSSKEHSKC